MSSLLTEPLAVCLTSDPALRRTLRRTLNAAGSSVEFRDSFSDDEHAPAPQIVFIDQACRRNASMPQLTQVVGEGGTVIILGESIEDDDIVKLMRHESMDHLISDSAVDETELVVTSVKLLSGDIFGLEKYLAWGVKVHEMNVGTYEEKRAALMRVAEHAKQIGARRHVLAKLESVTDELLMNALYDAPAVRKGTTPAQRIEKVVDATLDPGDEPALLRWGCDGRYFAVSVQDNYGELHKEAILDHLSRARAERGKPKFVEESGGGAGLGLYFILSSVTRFIANIQPGAKTEVVCMFDLRQSGRQAEACARSLHIFRIDVQAQSESDESDDQGADS